jgi:hypothetical protein
MRRNYVALTRLLDDPMCEHRSSGKPWEFRSVSIGLTDALPRNYSAGFKVYKVDIILYLPHPFVTNPCLGFCVLRESRKTNTQNSYTDPRSDILGVGKDTGLGQPDGFSGRVGRVRVAGQLFSGPVPAGTRENGIKCHRMTVKIRINTFLGLNTVHKTQYRFRVHFEH